MPLLRNIGLLIQSLPECQSELRQLGDAALAWRDGVLVWVGSERELPGEFTSEVSYDASGHMVVPGLIDCHTHLAFGGWRADEFEQRLSGTSYLEIGMAGGGILRTVNQTRAASEEELFLRSMKFLNRMARLGITTVECKSGYGLDLVNELKLLKVYRRLSDEHPVRTVPTLLAAHVVPEDFRSKRSQYVDFICEELIPEVAANNLARFCDAYVEDSAFQLDEARKILICGDDHGMRPKLHADQLTCGRGAELAAELGAVSADHLENISPQGIEALAEAGVVAVALPLASLYLQQKPLCCRRLIDNGVEVAVSTDFNPGSAPSYHLPLAMMLGCIPGGMIPAEVLTSVTISAAKALALEEEIGSLEAGKSADFAVIDSPDPAHWMYHFRENACVQTFVRGEEVWNRDRDESCHET